MTVSAISGGAIAAAPLSGGTKKSTKSKKTPSAHPPYGDMIKKALKELKERGGSSRQAIVKYIKANYKVDDRAESHLRRALVTGVKSGKIVHTKGIGASGSFKLADKTVTPKKTVRPKTAKPKSSPKKKAATKKPKTAKPKSVSSSNPTKPTAAAKPKPTKPKAAKPKKAKTPHKPKTVKPKKPVAKKTPKKVAKK
uniref:Histone H1-delta n=1 Tax=Schistosoma japonicum TaxID=6182 RepID=C1LWX2_SCHJA|nr:Histone H1-delta [Schistosoma japonicum]